MAQLEFDPNVIRAEADALTEEAKKIVPTWVMMAMVLGLFLGVGLSGQLGIAAVAVLIVSAGMGFVVGRDRQRQMLLDAQMQLLQLRIEENTRALQTVGRLGRSLDELERAAGALGQAASRLGTAARSASGSQPVPTPAPKPAPVAKPAPAPKPAPPMPTPVATPAPEPEEEEPPPYAAPKEEHPASTYRMEAPRRGVVDDEPLPSWAAADQPTHAPTDNLPTGVAPATAPSDEDETPWYAAPSEKLKKAMGGDAGPPTLGDGSEPGEAPPVTDEDPPTDATEAEAPAPMPSDDAQEWEIADEEVSASWGVGEDLGDWGGAPADEADEDDEKA